MVDHKDKDMHDHDMHGHDKHGHDKHDHDMHGHDKDMHNRGKAHDTDLPVSTEGGSEGLLNPEKAGRAREEAKRRGDQVSAQKNKDLEHRSIEEFGNKPGHQTYAADPKKHSTGKAEDKTEPLDPRKRDG